MKKRTLKQMAVLICLLSSPAKAEVFVSEKLMIKLDTIEAIIPAGGITHIPLPKVTLMNIHLQQSGQIGSAIDATICDEENLRRKNRRLPHKCTYYGKKRRAFTLSVEAPNNKQLFLILDNTQNLFVNKSFTIIPEVPFPLETTVQLQEALEQIHSGLLQTFDVPSFNINVKPCGQINAYSAIKNGDITLCGEVISTAISMQKPGIMIGILLHELGHTLLNLWGLPGWDNERTVDEFAVVMLIMLSNGNESLASQYASFFNESTSALEAEAIAKYRTLHPLGVQRIEAINQILKNPYETTQRWNRLLYPQMHTPVLESIANQEEMFYGSNPKLAREVLQLRRQQAY